MDKTTNLNIRIDPKTKEEVQRIFSQLGLTVSDAVNIFFRQTINYGGIPFPLLLNTPNKETLQAISDVDAERNMSQVFNNVEELMRDLDA